MKPVDRCRLCKRWRPDPYIRGQWISAEVAPPSKDEKPLPERWVTCEDCRGEKISLDAFKQLAELSKGHWNGVDALEYQNRVRGGVCSCGTKAALYDACPKCGKEVGGRFGPAARLEYIHQRWGGTLKKLAE